MDTRIADIQPGAVVWLKNTPAEMVQRLRLLGFHTGSWRDERDLDRGLNAIFGGGDPPMEKTRRLRGWIECILAEARRLIDGKCAIWHPLANEVAVRRAAGNRLVILDNPTLDAAEPGATVPPKTFWHVAAMGNWREVCVEQIAVAARVGIGEMTVGFLGDARQEKELRTMAEKKWDWRWVLRLRTHVTIVDTNCRRCASWSGGVRSIRGQFCTGTPRVYLNRTTNADGAGGN